MSEIVSSGMLERIDRRIGGIEAVIPPMAQALAVMGSQVRAIDRNVDSLVEGHGETRRFLASFYEEFHGYVEDYRRRTELQLAETRIVKVRQELERRFGHHDEVRRRVTGILQATDVAIVRAAVVRTVAEELMLGAPRYWLAPGLVALMGWMVDERDVAERALAEALRRDACKTYLFLTLVCRRAGRQEPMSRWLELYLQMLDPQAVDREVVVVLDAVASGTLGRQAQEVCWRASLGWIEALRQVPGEAEAQARRWIEVLEAERGQVEAGELQLLRAHCPSWPALEAALAGVRRNERIAARFRQVVEAPVPMPASVIAAVDGLLDTMVCRFDDEELPLRRQERLLQLVLEHEGDRQAAAARMAVEEAALEEKVSFVSRLTDILMHPEQAAASLAAQRYAAAFCRDWIFSAHQALVTKDGETVPPQVELCIGDWRGSSSDGREGEQLASDLRAHHASRQAQQTAEIKLPLYAGLGLGVGALVALLLVTSGASALVALIFLAVGGLLFAVGKRSQAARCGALAARLDAELGEAHETLEALLAELASYRRNWTLGHLAAHDVKDVLRSISAVDSLHPGPRDEPAALPGESADGSAGGGRGGAVLAAGFARWDLLPPPLLVGDSAPLPM
jgi:hypothetical protein